MALEFTKTGPELSDSDVRALEQRLGIELPDPYRRFLLRHNGGAPNRTSFKLHGKRQYTECIHYFLSIWDVSHQSFERFFNRYKVENVRMPENLVPIAYDPGGNLVCLSVSGKDKGSVYFWDHEGEADFQFEKKPPTRKNLKLIARNFDDFLNSLREE